MNCKTFEVRDAGTMMPCLAVQLEPTCEEDRWLLARAGYGSDPSRQREYVLLIPLALTKLYDPHGHDTRARTLRFAHGYAIEHFAALKTGQVIDVEHLLGETAESKVSERLTSPYGHLMDAELEAGHHTSQPELDLIKNTEEDGA